MKWVLALLAAFALTATSASPDENLIVVFRDHVETEAGVSEAMRGQPGRVGFKYKSAIRGFSVSVPAHAAAAFKRAMANNPHVAYVEADQVIRLDATQTSAPWGLDRSDQRSLPLSGTYTSALTGAGVTAYILDTGIRATHVDFGGRVAAGFTAILDGLGTNDCHGHGTHVAGTVGGKTWGIAKEVTLVPVRVLSCDSWGSTSQILAGIDWVVANANGPSVINMSIGGGASLSMDSAVTKAGSVGIAVVVSAGNNATDACTQSPARAPAAITVGSTASNDAKSSFSNYGTCVDLFAPGSSIKSASNGSDTATSTKSGTSMAAPHVTGAVALLLQESPQATAAQLHETIKAAATPGKVTSAGAGSPNLLLYAGTSAPAPPVTVGATLSTPTWRATVTVSVRDNFGSPVAGAVVVGTFSTGGTATCKTGTAGTCRVTSAVISGHSTTTFRVDSINDVPQDGPSIVVG